MATTNATRISTGSCQTQLKSRHLRKLTIKISLESTQQDAILRSSDFESISPQLNRTDSITESLLSTPSNLFDTYSKLSLICFTNG